MRRLLERVAAVDAETVVSLRVIDAFDRLLAGRPELDALAGLASDLTGRVVGVEDWLSGRRIRRGPEGSLDDDDGLADAVERAVVAARLRGRRAAVLETDRGTVLAVSLELATGRIGVVWAEKEGRRWILADQIALERLALSISVRASEEQGRRSAAHDGQRVALERLLCEALAAQELELAANRLRLDANARFVVVAMRELPLAKSSEALLATSLRELRFADVTARGTLLDRLPVMLVEESGGWKETLERLGLRTAEHRTSLQFGVGRSAVLADLGSSYVEARQALLLSPLVPGAAHVTSCADLGVLRLLAQLPVEEFQREGDYQAVVGLDSSSSGVSDLAVLEAYCETGSLRGTAARLFLHHTSVHYRVRQLEQALGFPLSSAAGRLRALLAVRLVQIARLRAAR